MRWGYFRKGVVCLVLVSVMGISTACYGPFNLTKNVYRWNSGIKGSGEVNEKWMKEFVFFGMIVIPVYMFSALLDAFIFNSIQFWSGDNPVKAESQDGFIREVRIGDTRITVSWAKNHQSADVTYWQHESLTMTATILRDDHGLRLIDQHGRVIYMAEPSHDGGVNIMDGDCRLVDHVSFERLRQASNELARASS